jgi:hypothetical protein
MSERTTEGLIRELARDLRAVRRIPRLRAVAVSGVVLWLAALGIEGWLGGPGPALRGDGAWRDPLYLGALVGLAAAALGATLAGLGAAVPGRETAARAGTGCALAGLGVAVAAGIPGVAGQGADLGAAELRACAACMARALELGAAPALVASAFVTRAATRRPGAASLLALAGSAALGASAVHATCPSNGAFHQLVGHVVAPVAAAALLSVPLAALLARWLRRT